MVVKMVILIINNYYKKENLSRADQIAYALRRINSRKSKIWPFSETDENKVSKDVEAIILSGSSAHLQNPNHLSMYEAEIRLIRHVEVPVLGICFGHQLIGKAFGSRIDSLVKFVKGFKTVRIHEPNGIFSSWKQGAKIRLAQSHKDHVANLPEDFALLASSKTCRIEAMMHDRKPIYGVQAHFERATIEKPDGWQVLKNFIERIVN